MSKKILSTLLIAGAALLCVAGTALAGDVASAMVGTWNLNVSKTQWHGPPALKSYTVTITDAGGGKVKNVAQWIEADGTPGRVEYTVSLDGTPSPVTGYPNADTVKMKMGKGNWLHLSILKGGKPVEWGRYKVSADGKTLNATEGGSDEKGTKYRWVEVFERQ
jgi:hypothetical protein